MHEERRDGTAAVRGGALVVTPPGPGGRPARVRGEAGVVLVAPDGRVVPEAELVDALGALVELTPLAPRLEVAVEIASDALSATMRVERVPGARYRLEDQPPNATIVLRRLVDERVPCPAPSVDDLRGTLQEHGVVHGIIADSLDRLVLGSASGEVVARGEPGRPASDGAIVYHALNPDGPAAYVRPGALLAEVRPAEPGEHGRDVYGAPIPPRVPQDIALQVGEGARPAEAGRVVAAVAGHACIEDGALVVRDPLLLDGDVSDRVATPGALEVTGGVLDLASVRARGDVLVHGPVRRATVEAGGSLVVLGAVVESTLRCGYVQVAAAAAAPALSAVAADLQRLHAAVGQVLAASHGAGRALPPARAVQLAEDRVASGLDERIRAAFAAIEIEHGTVHAETAGRLRDAAASLADVRVGRRPTSTLATLARAFAEEAATLAASEGPPLLAVPFAERSRLEVSGVLRLTGRGAVDCELAVRGRLEAEGDDTALRGGRLELDGDAHIAEASVRGGALHIALAPGSTLRIDLAHAGVVVDVAGAEHRVTTLTRGLELTAPDTAARAA